MSIYRNLGVEVEAVDSKVSKRTQDDCERRLISGVRFNSLFQRKSST